MMLQRVSTVVLVALLASGVACSSGGSTASGPSSGAGGAKSSASSGATGGGATGGTSASSGGAGGAGGSTASAGGSDGGIADAKDDYGDSGLLHEGAVCGASADGGMCGPGLACCQPCGVENCLLLCTKACPSSLPTCMNGCFPKP